MVVVVSRLQGLPSVEERPPKSWPNPNYDRGSHEPSFEWARNRRRAGDRRAKLGADQSGPLEPASGAERPQRPLGAGALGNGDSRDTPRRRARDRSGKGASREIGEGHPSCPPPPLRPTGPKASLYAPSDASPDGDAPQNGPAPSLHGAAPGQRQRQYSQSVEPAGARAPSGRFAAGRRSAAAWNAAAGITPHARLGGQGGERPLPFWFSVADALASCRPNGHSGGSADGKKSRAYGVSRTL